MGTPIVKSAARVLDLLELLATASEPMRLTDVVERLDIPKTSAFALLSTLLAKGYVDERAGGYLLPERLREQGWVGGDVASLTRVSRPVMAELARTSGESAFLGTMTATHEVRYIEKVLSPNPIRYDTDIEQPRAAYCTSIGLVLLASLPDADLDRYFRDTALAPKTRRTETDPSAIRALIAQARTRGYVHTEDSHFEGVAGVAAVIRGPNASPLAGLAIIGPSSRFVAMKEPHARAVIAAAQRIAAGLAGRRTPAAETANGKRRAS